MGWLSNLFGNGATDKIVDSIGDGLDNLFTSDEEKLILKNKLIELKKQARYDMEKLIVDAESKQQAELTERLKIDMASQDSWLSKNIRPMFLLTCLIISIILSITDGNLQYGEWSFSVGQQWVELWKSSLLASITFYFGGRSYEKAKRINKDK